MEELDRQEGERNEVRDRGLRLRTRMEAAKTQADALEKENLETTRKLDILRSSPEARCPLCDTDLDDAKRRNIEGEFGRTIHENGSEIEKLKARLKTDREARSQLLARYQEIDEALKALPETRRKLAEIEASYREILQAKERVAGLEEKIRAIERQMEEGDFAREEQETLAEIKRQIEKLGYDRAKHQAARKATQELAHFEAEHAELSRTAGLHREVAESLPNIREQLELKRSYLHDKRYAVKEQRELNDVLDQIKGQEYDPDLHRKVQEELEKLREVPARRERLRNAEQQMGPLRENIERLETRLTQRQSSRKERAGRQAKLEREIRDLKKVEGEIAGIESERRELEETRSKVLQDRGALQSQYDACLRYEEARKEVEERLEAASKDARLYGALCTAFGKEGIQALIIENAVPEIEEEANALLARLTDNRTQIAIESLRDLKTGGTRETLDIKISDELGERNYELYSGGEAFRTNFALRIALSKLLAKRAGTKLRTLVIDEGFGTQDAEGLEHLVDAIQAISDDFDKIVVVTHLEELKNAFPVRIEVHKLPEVGSRYEVIQ